jgi:hypothetical protein
MLSTAMSKLTVVCLPTCTAALQHYPSKRATTYTRKPYIIVTRALSSMLLTGLTLVTVFLSIAKSELPRAASDHSLLVYQQ